MGPALTDREVGVRTMIYAYAHVRAHTPNMPHVTNAVSTYHTHVFQHTFYTTPTINA